MSNSTLQSPTIAPSPSSSPPPPLFDIRALEYVFGTDQNLLCPICHSPLVDPVQTRCLHTFCSSCVSLALDRSPSCPVDRKPLTRDEVTPAPIMIANLVNELIVLCPNAEKGCLATCPRYLLDGHLKHVCGYTMVICLDEECDQLVTKKDAGEECLHKLVDCGDCETQVRKIDMEEHKSICPKLYTTCEHCTIDFPRSEITIHRSTCPSAIISCTSSVFGCTHTGPRLDLSTHTSSCPFVQLTPLLQLHTDRISKLELENRSIRKKLDLVLPLTRRSPHDNNDTSASNTDLDDHTYHLFAEQEHLRADVDRIAANLGDLEVKQAMLLMNENLRYNEEMAGIRAAINGLRMQLHWLITRANSVSSSTGNGTGSGPTPSQGGGAGSMRTISDTPRQIVKL